MKRKELCFFSYVKQEVNSDSFKLLLLTVKSLCFGFFPILTITLLQQQEQVMDSLILPSFWNHFTGVKFLAHFDFRKGRPTAQSKPAKRHIMLD